MIQRLDREHLLAEISGLEALLGSLAEHDYLGRIGLESRRSQLLEKLQQIQERAEHRAQVALYFGGDPVIGSQGVQAEFGTTALSQFQDLITKVWASAGDAQLASMGPIPDKASAHLHITNLVHGSFGFLLEELDDQGEPLFETPLRQATDKTVEFIANFAAEDEPQFTSAIENIDERVFKALRSFFSSIYRGKATIRIVEGELDKKLDRAAVERAWVRIEAADVEEERITKEGRLLGMIPMGRRFEFEPDGENKIITGKVGEKFSESYLERMTNEQFAGRRWKAQFQHVMVSRTGRTPVERFTLLELDEINKEPKP